MYRIETLKQKVDALYSAKNLNRADWADYLYASHVFIVANKAELLAVRFNAQKDIAVAAAMLHDIADAIMPREDSRHGEEGMRIARNFLAESDFSNEEIDIIVNDIIKFHSCKNGNAPQTLEGKVMATADALGHLQTDLYEFAITYYIQKAKPVEKIKAWGLEKVDRDFNKKIFFPEIKDEVRADYERLKTCFTNLT